MAFADGLAPRLTNMTTVPTQSNRDVLERKLVEVPDKERLLSIGIERSTLDGWIRDRDAADESYRDHIGTLIDYVRHRWSTAWTDEDLTLRKMGFTAEAEERLLAMGPYQMGVYETAEHVLSLAELPIWKHSYGENEDIPPNQWVDWGIRGRFNVNGDSVNINLWRSTDGKVPGKLPSGGPWSVADGKEEMDVEDEQQAVWTLYHGTTESAMRDILTTKHFRVTLGHDFFQNAAVYWTPDYDQAQKWAMRRAGEQSRQPAVLVLEIPFKSVRGMHCILFKLPQFDMPQLNEVREQLNCKEFKTMAKWQHHIDVCRSREWDDALLQRLEDQTRFVIGPFAKLTNGSKYRSEGSQVAIEQRALNKLVKDDEAGLRMGGIVFAPEPAEMTD